MDKLLKMKQQRAKQIEKLRALVTSAEKESRSLDDKEKRSFDEIESQVAQLDADIELEEKLLELESTVSAGASAIEDGQKDDNQRSGGAAPEYRSVFFKALRGQGLNSAERDVLEEQRALSVKEGEDGGYVIPVDITTEINKLKNTVDSLEQYVTVESVSTSKGARTLERRADSTPFEKLSEYGRPNALGEIEGPKFDRLEYSIDDYAGFLPVPNNLLKDSDQNIEAYLRRWIAKKSRATRNSLILAKLNTLTKVKFEKGFDSIQKVLDVTLDPAHEQVATIFTNQDGVSWMKRQKDRNGRSLMQPDPTNATRKLFDGKPIVKLSNKTIGTAGKLAPVIIGDLKEAIILWDREQMSLDMTTTGGDAWRTNSSEFRAIEREDVTLWDSEAIVYGQIDITIDVEYENPTPAPTPNPGEDNTPEA